MVYEVIKRLVRYLSGVPSSMRRSVNVVETLSANESALKSENAFLVTNVLFKLSLCSKTCATLYIIDCVLGHQVTLIAEKPVYVEIPK